MEEFGEFERFEEFEEFDIRPDFSSDDDSIAYLEVTLAVIYVTILATSALLILSMSTL